MGPMGLWISRASREEELSRQWLKEGVFESVKITNCGALECPRELDLCPDSIYMRLTGKTPEKVFQTLKKQLAYE